MSIRIFPSPVEAARGCGGQSMPPRWGEWHLLKGLLAQARFFAAIMALGTISKFVTWNGEGWIFVVLTFDGPGFSATRTKRQQIRRQSSEQLVPQSLAFAPGSRLGHRLTEFTQRIDCPFKTDPFQIDIMFEDGLDPEPANQMVSYQIQQRLLFNQGRSLAAQRLPTQGGLEIVQAHFQTPAPQIGL